MTPDSADRHSIPGHATPADLPDLTGKTVWVIDTLSRVYQLFHALPEMSSPTGTPVQAVYGFTKDLLGIIEKRKPDYLFCAMDAPGPTFRHEKHAAYKGTRAEMPGDLVPQIPLVRQLCATMGIPCLELSGFEADDILATLTAAVTARGGSVTLATSDKDARQLLGPHAVPGHQPEGLDVEDEAGWRELTPVVDRELGRDRVVRRVDLDRVVVLRVEAQSRLGRRRRARIPVGDQALLDPRARADADRGAHAGGCSAIQWRAMSTRRVTQASSCWAMCASARRSPSMRPGRPIRRQWRPMLRMRGVVAPLWKAALSS
jgi:hypothetical protein